MGVKTVYDSSLSAVADAIRAKTGKSASMEFPTEFVSEIGSISSGEVTELKFTTTLNASIQNMFLPDSIKSLTYERQNKSTSSTGGRLPNSVFNAISRNSRCEVVTVDYGIVKPTNAGDTFRIDNASGTASLKTVHLYADTSEVTGWDRFCYGGNNNIFSDLVIDGTPINFGKMSKWQNTLDLIGIKEIRFVPDKINVSSVSIGDSYTQSYSDDTWVSLANALKKGTAGTFTIGSTAQSTISAIMGNSIDDLFEISASGTMSLLSFITTVKGWTVA